MEQISDFSCSKKKLSHFCFTWIIFSGSGKKHNHPLKVKWSVPWITNYINEPFTINIHRMTHNLKYFHNDIYILGKSNIDCIVRDVQTFNNLLNFDSSIYIPLRMIEEVNFGSNSISPFKRKWIRHVYWFCN